MTSAGQSRLGSGDFVWSDEFPITICDSGTESPDSVEPQSKEERWDVTLQVDVTVPLKPVFKISYRYAPADGKIIV